MPKITIPNITIYDKSVVNYQGTTYFIGRHKNDYQKYLGVSGNTAGFTGPERNGQTMLCPLTPENAVVIRTRLPWLNAAPLGRQTSFGYGDRLGLATPGHIQAVRSAVKNTPNAPIYAQQSVRENTRTGRTPQQVMDDAMWGVLQEGWRDPWEADADHVKEVADLSPFVQAGYTFYTIDPSDHVDNDAQTDSLDTLRQKADQIPWDNLNTTYQAMQQTYCQSPIELANLTLDFNEETLLRALAKYGHAIVHTLTIAQALNRQMSGHPYDLEMSVDETDTPTSIHEHFFIANELLKRAVPVVSLAQMSRSSGLVHHRLVYMSTWFLREETLKQANTRLVNYHHALNVSHLWGTGTFSSSAGQRFPVSGKNRTARSILRYFGYRRGVMFYAWTSDCVRSFRSARTDLYPPDQGPDRSATLQDRCHRSDGLSQSENPSIQRCEHPSHP